MRIDERGLSPFLSYINKRLTGQPLFTALWLIYMLTVIAAVYALDSERGARGTFIMYWVLAYDLIVVLVLLSVTIRKDGRKWLLAKYYDCDCTAVSSGSRAFIRLLPVLGLIVVAEYLFLH